MTPQAVYLSSTKGQHFQAARADLVTLLEDWREQMLADGVLPNVTRIIDNHAALGVPPPFATVGITGTDIEYLTKSGATYDLLLRIEMEVWLHVARLDGHFDEREKWVLINSLLNYLKDTATIASRFDAMFLRRIEANLAFSLTGTQGAVLRLTIWKVASG